VLLEVRVFGGLTERVGSSRLHLELPDDASVGDLRAEVARAHPQLRDLLAVSSVAVDLEIRPDDHPLAGAGELALLPPVAGGATSGSPRIVTGLARPPLDVAGTLAAITGPTTGATALFLGTVRDHAPDLAEVVRLEYHAYPEMAEAVLARIADALLAQYPAIDGVALLHAVGDLEVGEHTVLIACAAPHRDEAFDACRAALERVKHEAPVWKREVAADGTARWVGLSPPAPPDLTPPAGPEASRDRSAIGGAP
jgi:MoaE-MoaD fusion protein